MRAGRSGAFRGGILAPGPVIAAWIVLLGGGCATPGAPPPGGSAVSEMRMLRGTWHKTEETHCNRVYPQVVEFREGGLYSGQGAKPGDAPRWDSGTWEIIGPTKAKISTANDAELTYEFSLQGETLTFVDQQGCRFQYRKAG